MVFACIDWYEVAVSWSSVETWLVGHFKLLLVRNPVVLYRVGWDGSCFLFSRLVR